MQTKNTYKATYLSAIKELTELKAELKSLDERRATVGGRMVLVKIAVNGLAPVCDEAPWVTYPELFPEMMGLSDAVRKILDQVPEKWLTPVRVRDSLKGVGYEGESQNILPSIHNVLKRLEKAGEVEDHRREGRTWYRCKPKPANADPLTESVQSQKGKKQNGKAKG